MQPQRLEAPAAYASLIARAAAFLLDWAIVLVIAMFLAAGLNADQPTRFLILLLTLSAYHIVMLIAMSATPGKMALRIHVSDASGARLQPDRAILRFLVFFVSVLIPVGILVSAALVLTDPQRRALHDRVARTRVLPGAPDYENTPRQG
jgi:uncharacterized RDD family membrane protein YckC